MQAELHPFQLALQAWPVIWLIDLLRYLIPATLVALVVVSDNRCPRQCHLKR